MPAIAGLVLACVAVYANSLNNPLLRDDKTALVNDRRANDPVHWREIFTRRYWHGLNDDPIYRPLTSLSFLLNRLATGDRPWGFRAVNVALHAAVCVVVYWVGLLVLDVRWAAWFGAMLFAVHAVHTEAVTAIVGRADMVVTLLLVAVTGLLLGRRTGGRLTAGRWAGVVGLSALALFFKETAFVVLPLVGFALLWRRWARSERDASSKATRAGLRRAAAVTVSVAVVCAGALALRYVLFGQLSRPAHLVPVVDNPLGQAAPADRYVTAIGLLGKYLGLLAWPHPLCCDYSYRQIPVAQGLSDPPVLIGLIWIAGIVASTWLAGRLGGRRGQQLALWCLGFFAITYGMIGNVVVVIGTVFGERLIYLSSVAWCWAVAAVAMGLVRRVSRAGRIGVGAICLALVLVNAGLTVRRNLDWRDRMTLWLHDVQVSPESSRCWSTLSKAYEDEGQLVKAVEYMRRALALCDGSWQDHARFGEQLAKQGDFAAAASAFRRACELARGRFRIMPAYRLGQCYMALKRPGPAIRAFEAAIILKPDHVLALNNLAYLEATVDPPLRDLKAAADHIEQALRLAPDELMFLDTAVVVYMARGQHKRAIELTKHALSVGDRRHRLYARLQQCLETLTASQPTTRGS